MVVSLVRTAERCQNVTKKKGKIDSEIPKKYINSECLSVQGSSQNKTLTI